MYSRTVADLYPFVLFAWANEAESAQGHGNVALGSIFDLVSSGQRPLDHTVSRLPKTSTFGVPLSLLPRMNIIHPTHFFWILNRRNIEIHDHRLLSAPDENA